MKLIETGGGTTAKVTVVLCTVDLFVVKRVVSKEPELWKRLTVNSVDLEFRQ